MRLHTLATALIPVLATTEASAFWFGRSDHGSPAQRRHPVPHPAQLAPQEREVVVLDERGMPVTTTTTVWEIVTQTQTIWVDPTPAQHPFETTARSSAVSASASASESVDAESAPHSPSATSRPAHASGHSTAVSQTESASASPTVSGTESLSASETSLVVESASAPVTESASTSETSLVVESASASATKSASASETSLSAESASASASASATESASASSASVTDLAMSSSSASPEESSSAVSASRPASASRSESASETRSASEIASETNSASASVESASATDSSSASATASASAESTSAESASTASASSSVDVASASPSPSESPSPSAAPSPSASASSGTLQPIPRTLMAGYYPDWSAWYLTPEQVDWSRFDIMDFAFAIPTAQGGLEFTQWDSSDLLHRLVKTAHAAGKRVKLSIGGWTGSQYFSTIAADDGLRGTFVQAMVDAYWTYKLDGIDIDWEYPNAQGAYGNAISSSDSANFLVLLQQLRAALPDGAIISLATQVWPFAGPNGSPLSDVSGFAAVIDWILIMNYDIWGSSSDPGPNAPLSDACGTSTQPLANAYAAVSSWTQAGMPADKITLGVPAYGYLSASWNDNLRTRDLPAQDVLGAGYPLEADMQGVDGQIGMRQRSRRGLEKRYVTVNSGWSTSEGQVMWHDLVSQGALAKGSDGKWIGAGGFERKWDQCSSTPFLKSTSSGQIISYDDPDSMSLKAQFAKQAGLRGCNVFSVDGDYTAGAWPLTDAVRSGLGLW